MSTKTIKISHLTRVEGHGGIHVELEKGRVRQVRMDIFEGTRFYEALLVGKPWDSVSTIISRVCAICSADHAVAAQMAIEDAFDVPVSDRTVLLRDLLLHGTTVESHALHLFLLVLPDFLGYPSALEMAKDHGDAVNTALFLKRLGNRIQESIGGRAIHPVNVMVGRFGRIPGRDVLQGLLADVDKAMGMVKPVMELMLTLPLPNLFAAPTVHLAIRPDRGYGYFGRQLVSSDGRSFPAEEFTDFCKEKVVAHSHAKQSFICDRPFMVGSLARLLLNGDRLTGLAREAYATLQETYGEFGTGNPLFNNLAQLVELVFSLEAARSHLSALVEAKGGVEDEPNVKVSASEGIGILEAPRGILYHRYRFDDQGVVTEADIITPTAQNLANIERDLRLTAEGTSAIGAGEGPLPQVLAPFAGRDLRFLLQVVARAYDPCISCSVH